MAIVKLDSIYAIVSKMTPEGVVMQEFQMISTDPWARNIQIPQIAIDTGQVDINSSLQQL